MAGFSEYRDTIRNVTEERGDLTELLYPAHHPGPASTDQTVLAAVGGRAGGGLYAGHAAVQVGDEGGHTAQSQYWTYRGERCEADLAVSVIVQAPSPGDVRQVSSSEHTDPSHFPVIIAIIIIIIIIILIPSASLT